MVAGLRTAWRGAVQQTRAGFTSLKGSPRDLYIIFILKSLESYNYFSLSRIFTLYLTEEFRIGDLQAGTLYGAWGTLLTGYGFLLGGLIDCMGVKSSLQLCFVLNVTSRFVMAATNSKWLLLVMLLGPNTVAGALGVPVMTIGVKRYTHASNRGFAFSLFYAIMNIAALTQGMLMDLFRIEMRGGFHIPSLGPHSLLNNGSRLFLVSGCLTSVVGLGVTFMLAEQPPLGAEHHSPPARSPRQYVGSGSGRSHAPFGSEATLSAAAAGGGSRGPSMEVELPSPEAPLLGPSASSSSADVPGSHRPVAPAAVSKVPKQQGGGAAAAGAVHPAAAAAADQPQEQQDEEEVDPLQQLLAAEAPPPKSPPAGAVAARLAGGVDDARAVLSSRGFWKFMAMCIFTVNLKSIFRHLDATLPKYQLRAFGCDAPIGLIYSINPAMIVLLVPLVGAMTTGLQHFDMIHYGGYVSALSPFWMVAFETEWATALFVAMLSLGEAIWSPRWYDYSMGVAPDGREGIFTALASAPLFAAMLPTGMISGALLQRYCPDNGQCVNGPGGSTSGSGGRLRTLPQTLLGGTSSSGGGIGGSLGAAAAAAGGEEATCKGRAMWLIVGCLTLSSPLLVLLTQRWIRPDPSDFGRLATRHGTAAEGAAYDVNEADPLATLENYCEARQYDEHAGGSSNGTAAGSQRRALSP